MSNPEAQKGIDYLQDNQSEIITDKENDADYTLKANFSSIDDTSNTSTSIAYDIERKRILQLMIARRELGLESCDPKDIESIIGEIKTFEQEASIFLNKNYDDPESLRDDFSKLDKRETTLSSKIITMEMYDGLEGKDSQILRLPLRTLRSKISAKMMSVFGDLFIAQIRQFKVNFDVQPIELQNIETQANTGEHVTELMLKRLANPIIRGQLVRIITADKRFSLSSGRVETEDETEQWLDKTIQMISSNTPIVFDDSMPHAYIDVPGSREEMALFFKPDRFAGDYGDKQKGVIEAHEKGHVIRQIFGAGSRKYFQGCLDLSAFTLTDEHYLARLNLINNRKSDNDKISITKEEARESTVDYLGSPYEIIERMSQLKNYFGFTGAEIFTREHLRYAKEHYIKDTRLDNDMTEFFQTITTEREDAFLEVINNAGI